MPESQFLNGKVLKRSLDLLQPPIAPDGPRLKRLLLAQGELAQFHDGQPPMQYLAYIELKPDQPRGHHFHKTKREYVYLIHGEMTLEVEDIYARQRASIALRAGDLAVIATAVAHVMKPLVAGHAIEFSETPFNPADIHRWVLT